MKKQISFVVAAWLLIVLSSIPLAAQTPQSQPANTGTNAIYTSAISADPIHLVFGWFDATYEYRLSVNNSILANGNYWGWNNWSGYGLTIAYRRYFSFSKGGQLNKQALEGFSLGPMVGIAFWSWKGDAEYNNDGSQFTGGTSVQVGIAAAYKWIFNGGWFIEPNLLMLFNPVHPSHFAGFPQFDVGGNIGYAW
jgi:hypothetical protein